MLTLTIFLPNSFMELCYQNNRVLSNRQSASQFNAISTQTVPAANFIKKTNAELMQVTLTDRKWLSDKVRKVGDSREWKQIEGKGEGWGKWVRRRREWGTEKGLSEKRNTHVGKHWNLNWWVNSDLQVDRVQDETLPYNNLLFFIEQPLTQKISAKCWHTVQQDLVPHTYICEKVIHFISWQWLMW